MTLPLVVGALGIVFHEDSVLLIRRKDTPGDKWFFPGGRLNHAEEPIDAVCREVFEETGIQVMARHFLGQRETANETRKLILHYFECEIAGPTTIQAQYEEVADCQWIPLEKSIPLLGGHPFEETIAAIRERMKKRF